MSVGEIITVTTNMMFVMTSIPFISTCLFQMLFFYFPFLFLSRVSELKKYRKIIFDTVENIFKTGSGCSANGCY